MCVCAFCIWCVCVCIWVCVHMYLPRVCAVSIFFGALVAPVSDSRQQQGPYIGLNYLAGTQVQFSSGPARIQETLLHTQRLA